VDDLTFTGRSLCVLLVVPQSAAIFRHLAKELQMQRNIRRNRRLVAGAAIVASLIAVAAPAAAHRDRPDRDTRVFNHVATFDVTLNGNAVAEIVDATRDGKTLIYTDSATGSIGFVDITDPARPLAAGRVEVGGEPTSVGVGPRYALVAVDTSAGNFDNPTGKLVVIDLADRSVVKSLPLGGQPDSVALSPDHKYAVVVLENQRDEEENDGLIPQLPAGQLVVIETIGDPNWWPLRYVDFVGLDMYAGEDPEPEYVDINDHNLAVVSLQENNHLAVVDLRNGRIVSDFPAGSTTIEHIDATEDHLGPQGNGVISLTETITRRREPDTVGWIDRNTFATANEGDYTDAQGDEGGSRSFTLFNTNGTVEYESGAAFEHAAISAGHYNEGRSENKGGEPEALEVGTFGSSQLLFVGAERANVIGVYDVTRGTPDLVQLLPTGIGPEGLKAVPKRDLLVAAAETAVDGVVPSMLTIYQWERGAPDYPQLQSSVDASGLPIGWVAMSGLAGHPTDPDVIYAVNDSILADSGIYTVDVSSRPAEITGRLVVTAADGSVRNDLDLEGIAVAPEGGFWVASEGRTNVGSARPNVIMKVDAAGIVQAEIALPQVLLDAGANSSGFEGIAVTGDAGTEYVYAVIQREWASDPIGLVKIARYDVAAGEWTFVAYALDSVESPAGGWVGLSELTLLPDGTFAVIERDNQAGSAARIKRIYGVDLAAADFQPFVAGSPLPVVPKALLADVLDVLAANSVWTPDKLEGLGVTADGDAFVVTDNDGLDDAVGQTVFVNLVAEALGE
jgi:Esterase-like activity of phytase